MVWVFVILYVVFAITSVPWIAGAMRRDLEETAILDDKDYCFVLWTGLLGAVMWPVFDVWAALKRWSGGADIGSRLGRKLSGR